MSRADPVEPNLLDQLEERSKKLGHKMHPIKWTDRSDYCVVPTHPKLEQLIELSPKGKNRQHVRGEVLLAYRDAVLNDGYFSVNQSRLDKMYGHRTRRSVMEIVGQISTVSSGHSAGWASRKNFLKLPFRNPRKANKIVNESHFDGASENGQQYVESLSSFNCTICTLDPVWYSTRSELWSQLCNDSPDWIANYCTGRSLVGNAVLSSLDELRLPTTIDFQLEGEKLAHANYWLTTLTTSGVSRHITRSYGRVYHPLMFSSKQIRRAAFLRGEPVAEVDLHATYHCLLARSMQDKTEQAKVIRLLQQGAFYDAFEPIVDLKAEIQRQVVFPRDKRLNMRPLMRELQSKLPGYAEFIERTQAKLKSLTKLAGMLMYNESMIFIEQILLDIWNRGERPVIPLHDGFLIRQSDVAAAVRIMSATLSDAFGFEPLIKTYMPSNINKNNHGLPVLEYATCV